MTAWFFADPLVNSNKKMEISETEARDMEMRRELQMALQDYLTASEPHRSAARDRYRLTLREFTDRVLGKRPHG